MRIFIVSLLRATQRREKISQFMADQQLNFEFFDAVDGIQGHTLFDKYYDEKKRIAMKGRALSPGELGCFASHYLLWEKCVKLNENILILEDDIHIKENFSEVIDELAPQIDQFQLLRLSKIMNPSFFKVTKTNLGYSIVKYLNNPCGTQGYLLSPNAAQKLIAHANTWVEPVDDYLDKEWLHKVSVYGIEPNCLKHNLDLPSDIGLRRKQKMTIKQRCTREAYRTYSKFRHHIYLLSVIFQFFKHRGNIEKAEKNS